MARYGRVKFSISYVVDLDDPEMIADAREAIKDDVDSAARYGDAAAACTVTPDETATEADIEDFLVEMRDSRVIE